MKCSICKTDVATVTTERGMQLHKKFIHGINIKKIKPKHPAAKKVPTVTKSRKAPMGKLDVPTLRQDAAALASHALPVQGDMVYWNPQFNTIPMPAFEEFVALNTQATSALAGWFERARFHGVPETELEPLKKMCLGGVQQALHQPQPPSHGVLPVENGQHAEAQAETEPAMA